MKTFRDMGHQVMRGGVANSRRRLKSVNFKRSVTLEVVEISSHGFHFWKGDFECYPMLLKGRM